MQEFVELRIVEEFASLLFKNSEGERLGNTIRKIVMETSDPRFKKVGDLEKEIDKAKGRSFYHGWRLFYKYSPEELKTAKLCRLIITSIFEPSGEECGTVYDESTACAFCQSGAKQSGPLFLDLKKIPKNKDFSKTIAGEIIVSSKVRELFNKYKIIGVEFDSILSKGKKPLESLKKFQLHIKSAIAEIVPPTRIGVDLFHIYPPQEGPCPRGDLLGLNLLSELSIRSFNQSKDEVIYTREFIGCRRGLLRPEREILISPKVKEIIKSNKLLGCEIEIAHLV